MAPDKDLKLNFDTPPEETISPDRNCSICYGRGTMKVCNPAATGKYNTYGDKECACITRRRVHQARVEHFEKYKVA